MRTDKTKRGHIVTYLLEFQQRLELIVGAKLLLDARKRNELLRELIGIDRL
jgi:hypothetical protein